MASTDERSFERARELLRAQEALSSYQLEELDVLLQDIDGTQFIALTADPAHARALKQYGRYARRGGVPIVSFLAALFVLSVVIGGALVLA